ncbi:MAG: LysM peptidoglycan-binding domain-containing protein [Crocinitomicaceae bacterium]
MAQEGKLEKLKIYAFSDSKFNNKQKDVPHPYEVAINPESYSLSYKAEYEEKSATGTTGGSIKYNRSLPESLSLEFLFDRTGAVLGSPAQQEGNDTGVVDDIKVFKKTTFDYDGDIHKPSYLKVSWGELLFQCVVTEFNIEYKLFNRSGKPIRAIVKVTFKQFIDNEKRASKEKKASPDLTHYRIVKEGDNLPLMTHRIYGDPKYYLEVARVNGLTNFRKLTPGQKITFPPIEKVG